MPRYSSGIVGLLQTSLGDMVVVVENRQRVYSGEGAVINSDCVLKRAGRSAHEMANSAEYSSSRYIMLCWVQSQELEHRRETSRVDNLSRFAGYRTRQSTTRGMQDTAETSDRLRHDLRTAAEETKWTLLLSNGLACYLRRSAQCGPTIQHNHSLDLS